MATVLDTKMVITKKPHKCWGCGGIIPKGRNVSRQSQADEGRVFSVYTCEICDMFINHPDFDSDDLEYIAAGELPQQDYYKDSIRELENKTGEKWGDAVQVHESLRKFIEAME